jgi:hypothetical protein
VKHDRDPVWQTLPAPNTRTGLSLGPKRLPGAAVESDEARSQGRLQRLAIHEAHHEQFPGGDILNHCGSQALHFVEVNLHRSLLLLSISDAPTTETKNPLRGSRQRAWISYKTF